jgi:hypothetical protein
VPKRTETQTGSCGTVLNCGKFVITVIINLSIKKADDTEIKGLMAVRLL